MVLGAPKSNVQAYLYLPSISLHTWESLWTLKAKNSPTSLNVFYNTQKSKVEIMVTCCNFLTVETEMLKSAQLV